MNPHKTITENIEHWVSLITDRYFIEEVAPRQYEITIPANKHWYVMKSLKHVFKSLGLTVEYLTYPRF